MFGKKLSVMFAVMLVFSLLSMSPQSGLVAHAQDPNLIGYWKFDEGSGTTAYDSSGNGNGGTLMNGPLWTGGRIGGALSFDGADDNVQVPDSNSLDLTGALTIAMWFKADYDINPGFPDYYNLLSKWHGTGAQSRTGYLLSLNTYGDGKLKLALGFGGGQWIFPASLKNSWSAGRWYHVAATYDRSLSSGNIKFYVNGVYDSEYSETRPIAPNTLALYINIDPFELWHPGNTYFPGLIDDVRVYNKALNEDEIKALARPSLTPHTDDATTIQWESDGVKDGNSAHNHHATRDFQGATGVANPGPEPYSAWAIWENRHFRVDDLGDFSRGHGFVNEFPHIKDIDGSQGGTANKIPRYKFSATQTDGLTPANWNPQAQARIREAFTMWGAVISDSVDLLVGLGFREANPGEDAEIVVYWQPWGGLGEVVDPPPERDVEDWITQGPVKVVFKSDTNWEFGSIADTDNTEYHFFTTALHEVGHVVGLDEQNDLNDVMIRTQGPGQNGPCFDTIWNDLDSLNGVRDLYSIPARTLTITITPQVGGRTNPPYRSVKYPAGAQVTVEATAYGGFYFDHWELEGVNVGSSNPYTVTMSTSHTLNAVFYTPPPEPYIPPRPPSWPQWKFRPDLEPQH